MLKHSHCGHSHASVTSDVGMKCTKVGSSSAVDKIGNVNRYSCSGIASLTVPKLCTPGHYSWGGDKHRNAHRVRKYSHTIHFICVLKSPHADIHVFGVNQVSVGVNTCIP